MKKILSLLFLIVMCLSVSAADFVKDGIAYNYLDKDARTVEVTTGEVYEGDIVIPAEVIYDGITWSVTAVGGKAFSYCFSLTSIAIPNSVITIGEDAFLYCTSLASVVIPNSVTTIGEEAFLYCTSLVSATIPNSVTTIENSAFCGCASLTSVNIPNSVTTIKEYVFSFCKSLVSLTIPNSVTMIGEGAFSTCTSLSSVNIPNSVTTIGEFAFSDCYSLVSVTIPNSVTTIEDWAFQYCSSLSSITCSATTPPSASSEAFDGTTYTNAKLYVPEENLSEYKSVDPWCNFLNIEGTTGIDDVYMGDGVKIWNDNGVIRIKGSTAPCEVFDMRGRRVAKTSANIICGLETGVYIVKVGNKTFKIAM